MLKLFHQFCIRTRLVYKENYFCVPFFIVNNSVYTIFKMFSFCSNDKCLKFASFICSYMHHTQLNTLSYYFTNNFTVFNNTFYRSNLFVSGSYFIYLTETFYLHISFISLYLIQFFPFSNLILTNTYN